jgi:hypothetical protein
MQAMGGMLQGYTKGRQDLFEREKVEFDKNLQAVKAHNDQINAAFDRYMKMAPANLTAAKNELNTKLVSIGANLQAKQVEMSGAQQAFENQLKVTQELAKVTTAANKLTGTGGSGTVNIIGPDGKPIVITKKQAVEAAQEGKPYTPANKLTEGSAAIDDATAKLLAEQFISGRTQALAGLGSGASGAANRSKVLNMISQIAQEKGYSGADLAAKAQEYMGLGAEMRAAGTASAKVGMAATETNRLFQPAIETSKKVSRFNFVPANKLLQMAEENISDPDLAKFKTATKAVINTYIRTISPLGVPSDFVRKHAYDLLETADSQEKYEAVIDQMKLEINAAVDAPEKFIRDTLNQWKGLKEPPASFPRGDDPGEAVAPKPSAASGGGKPTLQQFLEKAKASNPGSSDQELTDYYNKKYGSQ